MSNLKIFSGGSNLPLTQKICDKLNISLGDIYHHSFASKEIYCQFKENIRGEDVFLVQGAGDSSTSANDNLMQLLIMADAARRASADRVSIVLPMFFYSRSDKKDKSRTPISAKLIMDLFAASGVDRILTMDLHAPQIQGFSNIPTDVLSFEPILIEYIKNNYKDNIVIMAPDVGAVKRAEKHAESLKCDFGFISKKRLSDEHVELQNIVGDVKDKTVIIIDDLSESCGTLVQAAEACKKNGAIKVVCAITHNCITQTGMNRLITAMEHSNVKNKNVYIDEFIHSNTINHWWSLKYKLQNITQLDVSELFAKAIYNIHNNQSISELFI